MRTSNLALDYAVETEEQEAAYTEWLRAKVQEGLDDPVLIPHDEVMSKVEALLARLEAQDAVKPLAGIC